MGRLVIVMNVSNLNEKFDDGDDGSYDNCSSGCKYIIHKKSCQINFWQINFIKENFGQFFKLRHNKMSS